MKAYRFELREKIKWEWGFWALYGFSFLSLVGIGAILEKPIISWTACIVVLLVLMIIHIDFIGYKIRRKSK